MSFLKIKGKDAKAARVVLPEASLVFLFTRDTFQKYTSVNVFMVHRYRK